MNTPFRKPFPAEEGLPKATVFRALRSKLGGRPLPAAGGQPRRCTGARPNPSLAVGSRDFRRKHLGEPSIVERGCFQVLSQGHTRRKSDPGRRERPEVAERSAAVLAYGEHRIRKIGSRSSPGLIYL